MLMAIGLAGSGGSSFLVRSGTKSRTWIWGMIAPEEGYGRTRRCEWLVDLPSRMYMGQT